VGVWASGGVGHDGGGKTDPVMADLVVGGRDARSVVADLDRLHAPVPQPHLHLQLRLVCVVVVGGGVRE
jgi:hypothetical protein